MHSIELSELFQSRGTTHFEPAVRMIVVLGNVSPLGGRNEEVAVAAVEPPLTSRASVRNFDELEAIGSAIGRRIGDDHVHDFPGFGVHNGAPHGTVTLRATVTRLTVVALSTL